MCCGYRIKKLKKKKNSVFVVVYLWPEYTVPSEIEIILRFILYRREFLLQVFVTEVKRLLMSRFQKYLIKTLLPCEFLCSCWSRSERDNRLRSFDATIQQQVNDGRESERSKMSNNCIQIEGRGVFRVQDGGELHLQKLQASLDGNNRRIVIWVSPPSKYLSHFFRKICK